MSGWQDISTYDLRVHPDTVLVAFSDEFVTAAEYSEHIVGGPDDHRTWNCWLAGDKAASPQQYHDRLLGRAWPTHWRPLPEPPEKEKAG